MTELADNLRVAQRHEAPDDVSVRRWFAFYALLLVAAAVPLVILAAGNDWQTDTWWRSGLSLGERWSGFLAAFRQASPTVKLLGFAIYISLCCTFLPLPTSGIVAAVATQEVAVTGEIWTTALIVAAVGALASTIANLNDYHLFTWMLRHRRVASVRGTRLYASASRWFSQSPFAILVIFNFIPIPVDVIRMLATTYRYPRTPFAAANFIGRFVRYGTIAFVTFALRDAGWVAVVALLGLAVLLVAAKVFPRLWRMLLRARASQGEGVTGDGSR